jgi:aldehyde dehydrogenase (NAD+)
VKTTQLYIDGKWTDGASTEEVEVLNPASEEIIATVPQGTPSDVKAAVDAARRAFDSGPWSEMGHSRRAQVMLRMAEEFDRRREELIDLNIAEAGSTRALAEFLQIAAPIEHFADLAGRVVSGFDFERPLRPVFGRGIGQGMVVREPYGVAALVTAFNFPFYLNLFKIGPALAAGCTVVLKPSPYTPLEALVIGEVAEAAGLPAGVLNIVTGDVDSGQTLTTHPDVDVVSFTGSDVVGRSVLKQSADTLKKVLLELGGKSANIILEDADLDKVLQSVLGGFITHAGQGCALMTRVLVHQSLFDDLVTRVKATLGFLKIGDPSDPTVMMGPLIRESQRKKVEQMIHSALDEGAQIEYGGGRPSHLEKGFFVEPTLLSNVDNSMQIARKEVFGPVAVVIPFSDEREAVRLANDNEYGLAGGVWSADPLRALQIARQLRVGTVIVNGAGGGLNPDGPFGGYKQSGVGRENGQYGLSEFLQHKAIHWPAGNA